MPVTSGNIEWHINEDGLSNELVGDLVKSFPWVKPDFKGVHTYFNLSKNLIKQKNFSCIVNIGLHFIAIYAQEDFILYIDSFGDKFSMMPKLVFQKALKKFFSSDPLSRPVYKNVQQIQHITSKYCGLYASLFILHLEAKRKGFASYQNRMLKFTKGKLLKNDHLCRKYIKRILQEI